jgi:hypothetical protein
MNPQDLKHRFDELSAGRALGDLDRDEERELAELTQQLGISPDLALELLAATLEMDGIQGSLEPLPAELATRLHQVAATLSGKILVPHVPAWQKILRNPLTGWAAAAAVALFAVLGSPKSNPQSPVAAESRLRNESTDLIERKFEGLGDFKNASGKVIWSDQLQRGYMTLSGIPVNDPSKAQYQLWIVDPKRDEAPVDGGVFDIPTDGSAVVIPIAAKLALTNPQAFVITLEQPGGVVKSKQEKVVALAKG